MSHQYHITWPYRWLRFRAYQGRVVFWSWPLTKCWYQIGSRAHFKLIRWKQGRIVWKLVNAKLGLKVNQIITFSPIQMFFARQDKTRQDNFITFLNIIQYWQTWHRYRTGARFVWRRVRRQPKLHWRSIKFVQLVSRGRGRVMELSFERNTIEPHRKVKTLIKILPFLGLA